MGIVISSFGLYVVPITNADSRSPLKDSGTSSGANNPSNVSVISPSTFPFGENETSVNHSPFYLYILVIYPKFFKLSKYKSVFSLVFLEPSGIICFEIRKASLLLDKSIVISSSSFIE